jgi:hypothetical protein
MSRCESDLGNIHQQLQTLDYSTANIDEQGYCVLDRTLPPTECERWSSYVDEGLSRAEIGPLRTGREQTMQTYGSRNVLSLLPRIVELANIPVVFELCQAVLGEKLGVDDPRSSRRHGTGEWTALRPTRQSSIRETARRIECDRGKRRQTNLLRPR